ncbi:hypothetical protein GQ457_03G024150 [Hibiscus cannabinus]
MSNVFIDSEEFVNEDWELYIGMQFQTIDEAKDAIKKYNMKKDEQCKVTKATSKKYVCECSHKAENECNWKIRLLKSRRNVTFWVVSVYNETHTCSSN